MVASAHELTTIHNNEFLQRLRKAGVEPLVLAGIQKALEQGIPPDALLKSLSQSGKYPRLNETTPARQQVEQPEKFTDSDDKAYPALDWSRVDVAAAIERHTSTRLRKEGNTQLVGACPFDDCSVDDDGFICWPNKSKHGQHFYCRGCDRSGDLIKLLRELKGWTFQQTLIEIGMRDANDNDRPVSRHSSPVGKQNIQRVVYLPEPEVSGVPELPPEVRAYLSLEHEASPVLDAMIEYFRRWCTRSYEGYHEAVAIWVLTTIAARRIVLPWRAGVWTNFYLMLVSRSGRHAKTEAAAYGSKIIRDCGLGFLLAPEETSPQRMLSKMSGNSIPRNYSCMTPEEQERLRLKLAFSAQKGWQYDEFGDFLQDVVHSRGYNNLFYRLLKQLYDNKPEITYDTGIRGEEAIAMPSLSIIGTTAPESLVGIPEKVWTDGAFARISFIVPPLDSLKLQSAPDEQAHVPRFIMEALTSWHIRLGIPDCKIIDLWEQEEQLEQALGKAGGKKKQLGEQYKIERDNLPQQAISWHGTGIREAHEAYFQALMNIDVEQNLDPRLGSNYVRLPDMALKIAMLLASLENDNRMEPRHFARGMAITERWRANLHELLAQLSAGDTGSYGDVEDQIIDLLTRLKPGETIHPRAISRKTRALRKLGAPEIRLILEELVKSEPQKFLRDGQGREATYGLCS